VRFAREACRVAERAYDPGGQDGTYAEDLGEGGAGSFHLGFDSPLEVGDLPIQRTDLAQDLRSQPPSEAVRGALGPYGAQDACAPVGGELPGKPAGEEIPQEPMQAVERPGAFGHQVLSPLGKQAQRFGCGLGIYPPQTPVARGAQKAVASASRPSFLGVLPLQSTRTRAESAESAESLGGTSTTDSPAATSLPARCLPSPPAFSIAQRRSGKRFAQRWRRLKPARSCGKLAEASAHEELASGFVDRGNSQRDALCGDRLR
jgi:hypothetical protein